MGKKYSTVADWVNEFVNPDERFSYRYADFELEENDMEKPLSNSIFEIRAIEGSRAYITTIYLGLYPISYVICQSGIRRRD